MAKESDVLYFHEAHAVKEWQERLGAQHTSESGVVAACHDADVARVAKSCGFKDVFYAKESNADGLTKTVLQAVDFAKKQALLAKGKTIT